MAIHDGRLGQGEASRGHDTRRLRVSPRPEGDGEPGARIGLREGLGEGEDDRDPWMLDARPWLTASEAHRAYQALVSLGIGPAVPLGWLRGRWVRIEGLSRRGR